MYIPSLAAAALSAASVSQPTPYSIIVARSASPIHLQPLNANDQSFWVGKETQSYCPSEVVTNCPAGNVTELVGGNNTVSLSVEVPGGQQVYIDGTTGAVKFTQAHSASAGSNPIYTGWSVEQGPNFGSLSNEYGLVFCSSTSTDASIGPWQLFAEVPGVEFGANCLGGDLLTQNQTSFGAWQYS